MLIVIYKIFSLTFTCLIIILILINENINFYVLINFIYVHCFDNTIFFLKCLQHLLRNLDIKVLNFNVIFKSFF